MSPITPAALPTDPPSIPNPWVRTRLRRTHRRLPSSPLSRHIISSVPPPPLPPTPAPAFTLAFASAPGLAPSAPSNNPTAMSRPYDPREYELTMRQEPKQARMCGVGGEYLLHALPLALIPVPADRRPIDPPPIVQLRVIDPTARRPQSSSSRASSPGEFILLAFDACCARTSIPAAALGSVHLRLSSVTYTCGPSQTTARLLRLKASCKIRITSCSQALPSRTRTWSYIG